MSNDSKIEWTDATWNPVRGCTKISPGCKHCYAETFAERWRGIPGHPYEQGFDLRLVPEKLDEPLKWKKPRRIFVNSMSDLFQDGVPFEYIAEVFSIMALAHWHTFQVLTKRPKRMLEFASRYDIGLLQPFIQMQNGGGISTKPVFNALDRKRRDGIEWTWPLPNVWLGVSAENQKYFDERVELLGLTPAAVRFISIEPMLEDIDTGNAFDEPPEDSHYGKIGWVIVGGESGPGARPFNIQWARSVVQQCKAAGVACFVKQMGSKPVWEHIVPGCSVRESMEPLLLKDRKGGSMEEWPEDLRVREFPK